MACWRPLSLSLNYDFDFPSSSLSVLLDWFRTPGGLGRRGEREAWRGAGGSLGSGMRPRGIWRNLVLIVVPGARQAVAHHRGEKTAQDLPEGEINLPFLVLHTNVVAHCDLAWSAPRSQEKAYLFICRHKLSWRWPGSVAVHCLA